MGFFFFQEGGICSFLFPAQRLVGPRNWSGDTQLLLRNLLRPDKHGNHGTFTCKAPNIKCAPFQMGSWGHKLSQVSKSITKKKNVEFILKLVEIQEKKIKLSILYSRDVWRRFPWRWNVRSMKRQHVSKYWERAEASVKVTIRFLSKRKSPTLKNSCKISKNSNQQDIISELVTVFSIADVGSEKISDR